MATRRFMTTAGEQLKDVTEAVGAATATKAIELTVDLGAVITGGTPGQTTHLSRQDVLEALQRMQDYITAVQWPPA